MESQIYNKLKATFGDRLELDTYTDEDGLIQSEIYLNVGDINENSGIVECFCVSENLKDTDKHDRMFDEAARNILARHKRFGIEANNIHEFKIDKENKFVII